jgi:hypothetical protein
MSRRPTIGPGTVLALALGGVLAGHTLTYRVLLPDAHARAFELARTGHGYLSGANAIGIVVAVAALALVFLANIRTNTSRGPDGIVRRLAAFQVATFLAIEIMERLVSGSGVHGLPTLLLVGLPVQAAIAVALGVLVRALVRAARALTGSPRTPVTARAAVLAKRAGRPHRLSPDRYTLPAGRAPPVAVA